MDTTERLNGLADELTEVARSLFVAGSHQTSTKDVGRAAAYWSIAVRRLAESGAAAWTQYDSPPPPPPSGSPLLSEPPVSYAAELDTLVAFLVGDLCLDAFAYAELERSGVAPGWTPGGRIPSWWPAYMGVIDEEAGAFRTAARHLDITLSSARDLLVAHPDPETFHMPSFSSWGAVSLSHPIIHDERRARAVALLQEVNETLPVPLPKVEYHSLLDRLVAVAGLLDAPARTKVKEAYRVAGFYSPALTETIPHAIRLLRAHAAALEDAGPQEEADAAAGS